MAGHRYPAALVLDALEYAAEGKRAREVADALAIDGWDRIPHERTIQFWIRKGPPRQYRHASPYSDEDRARAVRLYLSGLALREVSEAMGPDGPAFGTIRSWIVDAGHKTRSYTVTDQKIGARSRGKTKQRKG